MAKVETRRGRLRAATHQSPIHCVPLAAHSARYYLLRNFLSGAEALQVGLIVQLLGLLYHVKAETRGRATEPHPIFEAFLIGAAEIGSNTAAISRRQRTCGTERLVAGGVPGPTRQGRPHRKSSAIPLQWHFAVRTLPSILRPLR